MIALLALLVHLVHVLTLPILLLVQQLGIAYLVMAGFVSGEGHVLVLPLLVAALDELVGVQDVYIFQVLPRLLQRSHTQLVGAVRIVP